MRRSFFDDSSRSSAEWVASGVEKFWKEKVEKLVDRERFFVPSKKVTELMSSPYKKSIREARLEKIELLLEEHEKSTFHVPVPLDSLHNPQAQPVFHVANRGFMFILLPRCALCSKIKCKIVSLTLTRSERKNKRQILKIRINMHDM